MILEKVGVKSILKHLLCLSLSLFLWLLQGQSNRSWVATSGDNVDRNFQESLMCVVGPGLPTSTVEWMKIRRWRPSCAASVYGMMCFCKKLSWNSIGLIAIVNLMTHLNCFSSLSINRTKSSHLPYWTLTSFLSPSRLYRHLGFYNGVCWCLPQNC